MSITPPDRVLRMVMLCHDVNGIITDPEALFNYMADYGFSTEPQIGTEFVPYIRCALVAETTEIPGSEATMSGLFDGG